MVRKGHPSEMEDKPFALQGVIIKKTVAPKDAERMAKDISKKDVKSIETKASYHFRVLPKTNFTKMFRSKKINKDITLVFGELKPQYASLSGRGFFDYFKKGYEYVKEKVGNVADAVGNYLSPKLDDYPNFTKKMLVQYGNDPITKLTMYRKPIGEYINVVINAVSLGKWNELVKKAGYDKFFHLSLIAEVKGEKLNIEKTDVVSISKEVPEGDGTESQDVPLNGKSFTLNELMQKTRTNMGDKAFFEYDGFKNNCQVFVSNLLKSVGLYGATEKGFAYQPIKEVIDELPDYVKKFQRGITDFSATLKRITGQGKNREQALKDQLHTHFGSRVSKKYMPQISAYKSGFLAGWDAERQQAPSEFKDNLVEVWARAYDDGREAKQRYEEDTESDIVNMGTGRPQIPMPYSSSEGMYNIGFGKQEMDKFMMFLKQKGIEKKPSNDMLKKLYREFSGKKRLRGSGFWDDFKRGFNMVFEPASKYVLKPLMALSGTPMGLAGVAGLSALGYGNPDVKQEQNEIIYPTPRNPPTSDLEVDFGQDMHPIWKGSGVCDTCGQGIEGGASRGYYFMRALNAKNSNNPEVIKKYEDKVGEKDNLVSRAGKKRRVAEINESKFSKWDIQKLPKATKNALTLTKKQERDEEIKRFHDWLKLNAPLFDPQARVDGKNMVGLHTIADLFEAFQESEEEKEDEEEEEEEEEAPAPLPVPQNAERRRRLYNLATAYYQKETLAKRQQVLQIIQNEGYTAGETKTALGTARQRFKRANDSGNPIPFFGDLAQGERREYQNSGKRYFIEKTEGGEEHVDEVVNGRRVRII